MVQSWYEARLLGLTILFPNNNLCHSLKLGLKIIFCIKDICYEISISYSHSQKFFGFGNKIANHNKIEYQKFKIF